MAEGNFPILHAAEAAAQPIPQYLSLNYADLFKIQRVTNPYPLRPVSFSRLTSYLECPNCALEQQRRRSKREPRHFTHIHQGSLFSTAREPDPRLVGTLLHAIVDLLHEREGPLESSRQASLLIEPDVLTRFIRYDLLNALQEAGKLKLAMFLDEMAHNEDLLYSTVLAPLLNYQRELRKTNSVIFAASERFQFKLLSTGKTFEGHQDWGGYVGLVGEFDQIRLMRAGSSRSRPAIMEFKKGLGKKRSWDKGATDLESARLSVEATYRHGKRASRRHGRESSPDDLTEPGLAHAFQLMIYWLAFQTRWDIMDRVLAARGQVDELPMELHQELDLILYNLHDSCQYLLAPTDLSQALLAVIHCIFYTNWSMKSGYAWKSPDHECGKTQLLDEVPDPLVQVGFGSLTAGQCFELAREAFGRFSETVRWQRVG